MGQYLPPSLTISHTDCCRVPARWTPKPRCGQRPSLYCLAAFPADTESLRNWAASSR
jgi:hypothetical protein